MLGVLFADDFSVIQHLQQLVMSSAQTNYALRVLRCRGLSNAALQLVYRATVVARLTYAASAWRSLTKTSDRQRINSVIDRARRLGGGGGAVVECPTRDRKIPGSILGSVKK